MLRFFALWVCAVCFGAPAAYAFPDAGLGHDATPAGASAPSEPAAVAASIVAQLAPASLPVAAASIANPDVSLPSSVAVDAGKVAVGAVRGVLDHPTLLGAVFAISACLWAVVALLRIYGPHWLSPRFIRLATLVAAPVLTFGSAWGGGMPWFEAVILAGGGPGALLLNELVRGLNPKA